MAAVSYYYMLGQDNSFKGSLSETWLTNNLDESLDDTEALIDMWDYDAATLDTYDTTPGSCLSNTQVAGDKTKVAMDVSMWRHLLTMHPTGFSVIKRYAPGAVGNSGSNRWAKTYSEAYATFAVADTALRGATTGAGDTVFAKGFFLSYGYVEATIGSGTLDAAFKTDLQQLILNLRTDYASASTPCVFDLPPSTVSGYTAPQLTSLANARKAILEVAAADANVSYVECDSESRTAGGVEFTGESTMSVGLRMAKEMERMVDGKNSVAGLGVPLVVMIGDDQTVGQAAFTFLEAGVGDTMDGPMSPNMTWNWSNSTWETLDGTANSNTDADGLLNFGPDVSMADKLLSFSFTSGVYLFKRGVNASSLGNAASTGGSWAQADADLYTSTKTDWDLAKQALYDVEGKVPDVVAMVWFAGEEDVATQALSEAYALNLKTMIASYRGIFQTRVGVDLPIIIARMQDTGTHTQDYVFNVRAAADQMAIEDTQVTSVDIDTLAVHNDAKNLSGSGIVDSGQAFADAINAYL